MRSEEDQQAAIGCREEVKRVQCDHCNGYENDDIAVKVTLCESCQNKLERYDRLLMALRDIFAETDERSIREIVQDALNYCREVK